MLDLHQVHWLTNGPRRDALRADPEPDVADPYALATGTFTPRQPLRFQQFMGSRPYDLVPTGYAPLLLVSQKIVDALAGAACTGWRTFPVELLDARGKPLPGYHGLAVTGRCGRIDDSLSPRVTRLPKSPSGKPVEVRVGYAFAPESWDGSDLFAPEGSARFFAVQRVKEILEGVKASNVQFFPITGIERLVI